MHTRFCFKKNQKLNNSAIIRIKDGAEETYSTLEKQNTFPGEIIQAISIFFFFINRSTSLNETWLAH